MQKVTMVFTDEDKILVKVLWQDKGYSAKNSNQFSDKQWSRSAVDRLLRKIDVTASAERNHRTAAAENAPFTRARILTMLKSLF